MVEIIVAYYLGIDGGGTKTTCAVGDEHTVLASTTSGPSNIIRVGEERARESIHQAIRSACEAAKLDPTEINRACVGAAGAARKEVAEALRKFGGELIHSEIEVVGDMTIAVEAAFGEGSGVIVNAGTGSFAYGRNIHGTTARAGGWGFAIGDEGSAHWCGRQAVVQLLRAIDESSQYESGSERMERSPVLSGTLFRKMKTTWNVDSVGQLARQANSNPDFSTLFPAVLAAADSGENLAQEILQKAAAELARLTDIVIHHLFSNSVPVPVAVVGGVFRHSEVVRQRFYEQVLTAHPAAGLNPEIVEPVYGALQMARKRKG